MDIAKGPLNRIGLRTVGRQVEQLEAGMGGEPLRHCGRLVNLGIVHHHLEVQVGARGISAYPNNPEARKAMRAQAKWRKAR